jgi:hypothetical protein
MMRKIYAVIILFIVYLIYSACMPEFINPLSEPQNAKIDQRLLGTWFTKNIRKNIDQDIYINFEIDKDNSKLINTELKVINNKSKDIRTTLFTLFITSNNDNYFMNAKENKEGTLSEYYNIAKYEIKNDKLKLYLVDEEKLDKAIENNKILGTSKNGMFYHIKVTDTGLNTLNLLNNNKLFILFADFQKVK